MVLTEQQRKLAIKTWLDQIISGQTELTEDLFDSMLLAIGDSLDGLFVDLLQGVKEQLEYAVVANDSHRALLQNRLNEIGEL